MHPAASQSLLAPRPLRLKPFIVGSLVAHVVVVLGLGALSLVNAGPAVDLNAKPIRATLVRKGKARDERLLPRKEEPAPPPKEVAAPPAPPQDAPAAKPSPTAVPTPTAKAPAPQPGAKAGEDRSKRLFGAFDKLAKSSKPQEELEGAEDGHELGDSATAEGDQYLALVSAQVKQNYNVSSSIPDDERMRLKATVNIKIGRSGNLVRAELVSSSGNALFDEAVLLAVKRTAPFSPPPEHLRDTLARQGQAIIFVP